MRRAVGFRLRRFFAGRFRTEHVQAQNQNYDSSFRRTANVVRARRLEWVVFGEFHGENDTTPHTRQIGKPQRLLFVSFRFVRRHIFSVYTSVTSRRRPLDAGPCERARLRVVHVPVDDARAVYIVIACDFEKCART